MKKRHKPEVLQRAGGSNYERCTACGARREYVGGGKGHYTPWKLFGKKMPYCPGK